MKINYALTLLSWLYTFVRWVEYLQSGITLAIQKDISQSITKDFWDSFSKNLKNTTFCDKKGWPIDHSEDKQIIGIQSNITIFNMKFKDINFTQADHMMVLIESSQTIKIVIDKFYFKVGFDFDANSTIFSDSGNGTFSNNMTITLAITPTYWSETGKLKIHFNSIVVNNAPNQEAYKFELNAKTFPIMQVQENIERWRGFIITKMNELLKIFQQDIENYINQFFGNKIYSFTNRTIEQYTSWNLTAKSDIQLWPLAIPIRYVNDCYS